MMPTLLTRRRCGALADCTSAAVFGVTVMAIQRTEHRIQGTQQESLTDGWNQQQQRHQTSTSRHGDIYRKKEAVIVSRPFLQVVDRVQCYRNTLTFSNA